MSSRTVTIDLRSEPAAKKKPLVCGDDGEAVVMARAWARNIKQHAAFGSRPNPDYDVVANLVRGAVDGKVALTRGDAIHVYLLGWDWMRGFHAETFQQASRDGQDADLRKILTMTMSREELDPQLAFLKGVFGEESVSWMHGVLSAVAAALSA